MWNASCAISCKRVANTPSRALGAASPIEGEAGGLFCRRYAYRKRRIHGIAPPRWGSCQRAALTEGVRSRSSKKTRVWRDVESNGAAP